MGAVLYIWCRAKCIIKGIPVKSQEQTVLRANIVGSNVFELTAEDFAKEANVMSTTQTKDTIKSYNRDVNDNIVAFQTVEPEGSTCERLTIES